MARKKKSYTVDKIPPHLKNDPQVVAWLESLTPKQVSEINQAGRGGTQSVKTKCFTDMTNDECERGGMLYSELRSGDIVEVVHTIEPPPPPSKPGKCSWCNSDLNKYERAPYCDACKASRPECCTQADDDDEPLDTDELTDEEYAALGHDKDAERTYVDDEWKEAYSSKRANGDHDFAEWKETSREVDKATKHKNSGG